jgi:hypothetical protein
MSKGGRKRKRTSRRVARRQPAWTRLDDDQLLERRFCDLRLSLNNPLLKGCISRLTAELARRGLKFRPHFWLAEEWFSPDGIPGIAIPFYMAHPRLMQLERKLMGEVEGGNENWLMRILRHEAGHAIDTAYRLRRRKDWRTMFGKASRRYPNVYRVRPASRRFVLHLGHWYAQSHPTEDFAETFAVWLQPRSGWRRDYEDWPALEKLKYVDKIMQDIRGVRPLNTARDLIEPLTENQRTLADHYRRQLERYDLHAPDAYDTRLKRVFGPRGRSRRGLHASTFLREVRPQLTRLLIRQSRLHPYLVHHMMRMVIRRCRELNLDLKGSQRDTKRAALGLMQRILLDLLRRDRERYAL